MHWILGISGVPKDMSPGSLQWSPVLITLGLLKPSCDSSCSTCRLTTTRRMTRGSSQHTDTYSTTKRCANRHTHTHTCKTECLFTRLIPISEFARDRSLDRKHALKWQIEYVRRWEWITQFKHRNGIMAGTSDWSGHISPALIQCLRWCKTGWAACTPASQLKN